MENRRCRRFLPQSLLSLLSFVAKESLLSLLLFLNNNYSKTIAPPQHPKIGVVWREVESGKRSSISGDNYMKSRLISVLNHHH